MRRPAAALACTLLAGVLGSSCQAFTESGTRDVVQDIAEFLGRSNPARHIGRLDDLHDRATFVHRPDLPPSVDACVEEVRTLGKSDYEAWRDVAVATWFLTRVAAEDSAALNRCEAVSALERMGKMVEEAADPPAVPASEQAVSLAMKRLGEIHDAQTGLHLAPESVGECRERLLTMGDYRPSVRPDAPEGELRAELRILRGTLLKVVGVSNAEAAHDAAASRTAVDRAVVNLAGQAVRLSLAVALRFDGQPTVRAAAARVLGALVPGGQGAVLGQGYVREPSEAVRREILRALRGVAAQPGPDRDAAVPVLILALGDDDESAAFQAREALRAMAGEDLGARADAWISWWARTRGGGR